MRNATRKANLLCMAVSGSLRSKPPGRVFERSRGRRSVPEEDHAAQDEGDEREEGGVREKILERIPSVVEPRVHDEPSPLVRP